MRARYGPWEEEIREEEKKAEDDKKMEERKAARKRMAAKRGAEFVLVNYETAISEDNKQGANNMVKQTRVQFPVHLFQYGWRLHSIKMVNHSHWVLTLYCHQKLMDVILSPSI